MTYEPEGKSGEAEVVLGEVKKERSGRWDAYEEYFDARWLRKHYLADCYYLDCRRQGDRYIVDPYVWHLQKLELISLDAHKDHYLVLVRRVKYDLIRFRNALWEVDPEFTDSLANRLNFETDNVYLVRKKGSQQGRGRPVVRL